MVIGHWSVVSESFSATAHCNFTPFQGVHKAEKDKEDDWSNLLMKEDSQ